MFAEDGFDRLRFGDIALRSGGAVGVDVGNVRGIHARRAKGHRHATGRSFAAGRWGSQMMSIGSVSVADDFRVNPRAAGLGVFEFFQDNHPAAFAHDKSVATDIEWPGGMLGIVIAGAQGAHGAETAQAEGDNRRFAATGEHEVCITHFYGSPCFTNGIGGSGAGGTSGEIRPLQIVIHGKEARPHVQDQHWDHEGGKATWPFSEQNLVLFLDGVETADAGADERAGLLVVHFAEVEAGVEQRLVSGEYGELRETIGAPGIFWTWEGGNGIEIGHFGGDSRREIGDVKRGDRVNAAFAGNNVFPEDFWVFSKG